MSKIEWTESTWNPVVGCTRVSEGCRNCYAERMSGRLANMAQKDLMAGRGVGRKAQYAKVVKWRERGGERPIALPQWNNKVVCVDAALTEPLRWKKPRRIFVNSMSDLFHRDVPFEFIDRVFAVMALCPQHTFQVLTKRPERMAEYLGDRTLRLGAGGQLAANPHERVACAASAMISDNDDRQDAAIEWPLPNVWLGTSCEDQATADQRIQHLLNCAAAVRFLSLEPLLGAVDFECGVCTGTFGQHYRDCSTKQGRAWRNVDTLPDIHWCIVGCESRGSRVGRFADGYWPAARSIIDQCRAAGVPCFHKQAPIDGRVSHDPTEWLPCFRVRQWPKGAAS